MRHDFLRSERLPNIWCPGCGNGIVLRALLEAIDQLQLDPDKVVLVSGIGCSSRAPAYTAFDNVHTLHGRAIPVATGIKLANPDLTVIVVTGDGDSSAIG
ncbi:MAG TPA: thiamine pyrophosphate-dependent enzyme, partial [Candidatus Cryosericum sp.]